MFASWETKGSPVHSSIVEESTSMPSFSPSSLQHRPSFFPQRNLIETKRKEDVRDKVTHTHTTQKLLWICLQFFFLFYIPRVKKKKKEKELWILNRLHVIILVILEVHVWKRVSCSSFNTHIHTYIRTYIS